MCSARVRGGITRWVQFNVNVRIPRQQMGSKLTQHVRWRWRESTSGLQPSYQSWGLILATIPNQITIPAVDRKNEDEETRQLFGELGVKVVTGQHSLCRRPRKHQWVCTAVVQTWAHHVEKLSNAMEPQPQAASAALTKSLQFEWTYLQCVIPSCAIAFAGFVFEKVSSAVLGGSIYKQEKATFLLPACMGGMGVWDPMESSQSTYTTSKADTPTLIAIYQRRRRVNNRSMAKQQ